MEIDVLGLSAFMKTLPFAGGTSALDGPLPIGEIIGAVALLGAGIYDIYDYFNSEEANEEPTLPTPPTEANPETNDKPSGGGKNDQKQRKNVEDLKAKLENARNELKNLDSTRCKTKDDKQAVKDKEREINHLKDKIRASENHSMKPKR
jgi:predicted RNase H-like nuclease (RuvC/YqgF family)